MGGLDDSAVYGRCPVVGSASLLAAEWRFRFDLAPPMAKKHAKQATQASQISVEFTNHFEVQVELFWVDDNGKEVSMGKLSQTDSMPLNSFQGHLFRARDAAGESLGEFTVGGSMKQSWDIGRH